LGPGDRIAAHLLFIGPRRPRDDDGSFPEWALDLCLECEVGEAIGGATIAPVGKENAGA